MSNLVQALRSGYLAAGRCDTDGRREADLDDLGWDPSRSLMTRTPTARAPPVPMTPAFEPPAGAAALLNAAEHAQDAIELMDALKVLSGAWEAVRGPWLPQLAEALASVCPRDRLEAAAKLFRDQEGLAAKIARRACYVEKIPWRAAPEDAEFWHTEGGEITGETFHDARGDTMARESATREASARRLAKRLAGDRILNQKPKNKILGRTLSEKAPLTRFPHRDRLRDPNRAVPWHSDDVRGRDVFRGYGSTHTAVNGRCCWDPNLMPIVTPGPTTNDDFVQQNGSFMGDNVSGLPFSRMTELARGKHDISLVKPLPKPGVAFTYRGRPSYSYRKEKAAPNLYSNELFGKSFEFVDFEPSRFYSDHTDHEISIARAFAPVTKVQPPTAGESLKRMQKTNEKYLAKVPNQVDFPFRPQKAGRQRFLTDERVTIFALPACKTGAMAREPGLGLHRPIKEIVSPGPVYDLRVHLPGRGPARMEAQKRLGKRAQDLRYKRDTSLMRASLGAVSEVREESSVNATVRVKAHSDSGAKTQGGSATFATAIRGENATYDTLCGGTFMPPSFTPSPLHVTAPDPADLNANPRRVGGWQPKPCAASMIPPTKPEVVHLNMTTAGDGIDLTSRILAMRSSQLADRVPASHWSHNTGREGHVN